MIRARLPRPTLIGCLLFLAAASSEAAGSAPSVAPTPAQGTAPVASPSSAPAASSPSPVSTPTAEAPKPAPALSPAASSASDNVSSENRAIAETLFFTGRGLMEAHRAEEACKKFAESYRLDPAAGTLLNLAVCQEEIGKIASAWGSYRQAVSDARKAGRSDREAFELEKIAALEPELPYLLIRVPANLRVPGLEILRNGVPLQSGAWGTELPVDPGQVSIEMRAPGYVSKTSTILITRRQHSEFVAVPLALAPLPPKDEVFWSSRRSAGAAIVGLGLVSAGIGTYYGLSALNNRSKSDTACPVFDDERRCSAQGADYMSKAQTQAWISDVSIGVGALGIIAGSYFFFTKEQQQEAPKQSSPGAWSFSASAGSSGATGVLGRSF